ncbi:hypothetical protein A7J50_5906 (plasmid) [Pseudomonas antarctica]|uniref:Transmembrane protein n=1 Tax=Pseudomonas antarctica TaxID=219572 RepID=A0A172Z9P6_9PSED|nr:hypothetical protein [Pseudomonas antarctica]ANF89230.1 hypothetical protein A7J50_5906 [Pseudomonas antarctica]
MSNETVNRLQFTSEFHAALNAEKTTFDALEAHWESNPVKWKFWRRPPPEWKQTESQLYEAYKQACLNLRQRKDAQTPGQRHERYNALKFGGIFALIFFVGIISLGAINVFNDDQESLMASVIALMACVGAVGAIMCAFIFAE